MPPISNDGKYIVAILNDIGPVVPIGMGGLTSFSETELMAWQANQSIRLKPWECRLLRRLSREYAAMHGAASKSDCPAPWTAPLSAEARRKIAKGRLEWARGFQKKP